MWPGEQQPGGQSGGQQYPPGNSPQQPQSPYGQPPNPYAQPGYQQPGYPQSGQQPPAQPPGPPQQPYPPTPPQYPSAQQPPQQYPPAQPYATPSPYGQPGYGTPQSFGPVQPGGPGGGRPPGRNKARIGVAIGAALAVIAAVVVTVVLVGGGDKKKDDARDSTSPSVTASTPASPTATPTPTATSDSDDGDDDPRGAAGSTDVKAVIPGWQPVKRTERNSVFDVPPQWTLDTESMTIGYTDDKDKLQVAAGAPAYYMEDACKDGKNTVANATAATKGGSGASSLRAASENESRAWAKWAFQENGKGTVSAAQNSKAFSNAYGITGWQSQATMTHVPKANKCSSDGIAYTVAWLDPAQAKPTVEVWVLWARQGVPNQLSQSVVDQIKSSIRPLKTK